MKTKKCENCKYFKYNKNFRNDGLGYCHINPPVLSGWSDPHLAANCEIWPDMGYFPSVTDDKWCGKWEEKEPEIYDKSVEYII